LISLATATTDSDVLLALLLSSSSNCADKHRWATALSPLKIMLQIKLPALSQLTCPRSLGKIPFPAVTVNDEDIPNNSDVGTETLKTQLFEEAMNQKLVSVTLQPVANIDKSVLLIPSLDTLNKAACNAHSSVIINSNLNLAQSRGKPELYITCSENGACMPTWIRDDVCSKFTLTTAGLRDRIAKASGS
jgi:hypothetical protein